MKFGKRIFWHIRAVSVAVFLVLVTMNIDPCISVLAFKPKNTSSGKNPSDSTHQSITEDAIKELDGEFFAITNLTKSMKKAIEQIADANAGVDLGTNFFSAEHHFDDEKFAGGQALLVGEFQDILSALNNKNTSGARSKLGQALHTLQDFYSHSDWIETGNASPNDALGRPGQTLQNLSPLSESTCNSCTTPPCTNCANNVITARLTSGYFGIILSSKPTGKCSHGGSGDATSTTPPTGGINKDTSLCSSSPHDGQHSAAAAVAKAATKQFIRDIKAKVTPRQLKLLLGVGPTLAIVMDTTGSMGSIIDGVKQQAIQIVDNRLGTDEEPSKYVLAPFNDPDVGPVTVTDDPDAFKGAISALFASGGGDCPELSMSGMLQGLSASDDGGDLFMFTDASSKDDGLAGNVSSLATSKDIQIFPMLFGSCSPVDPGYVRVANDSGGQLFFLFRSEAGNIARLADILVRSNSVDLLSIGDTLAGVAKTYTVPVDSTMTKVNFSVSGTTSVAIQRPDGSAVNATDAGVTFVALSSGAIFSIASPASGGWSITVNGSGGISLLVSGESNLTLTSFRFVELGGRAAHEGFSPIAGLPVTGQMNTADAVIDGAFNTAQFEFRTKAGGLLQAPSLTRGSGVSANEFVGDISLPNAPFLTYVTGFDAAGTAYQRVLPKIIQPQTVKVFAPPSQDLAPGQVTSYVFQVKNFGSTDTFRISGSDDKAFLRSVSPTALTLTTSQTLDVTVQLQPPATAAVGASDTLTVTVESTGTSGARNFAVVTSIVATPTGNHPPDTNQARPSVSTLWPADHGMVALTILGVTDPDGDPITIRIDRIMQDEPTNGTGDGDTCPDGQGVGTATAQLRAERSGDGNGRVYTIFFTATDGRGGSTQGSVKVSVPHDQAHDAVDDGALFDSTVCP